ncbi:two-component system sensor histidine kinase NtrB [Leadbettera azotonutricia]|uniref:histidine kinase n=1 Tax=Leadbettera azotonutricia (strain ATCC BAA-888 / DSM 13862 / ZAS-9) TaxID=545695 RepID=F5YFI5_LEAAZ|nr:ATP-binding protein [Leadbettera azotonutricia]AEF82747.1 sensor protein ZraS [Leadbettera azotonutricia ZAS-9]
MRQFIKRALQKSSKLTTEQLQELLVSASGEIERLEAVLDSLSEGIMVLDTDHTIVLANMYARRILPSGLGEQTKEPIWEIVSDAKVGAFLQETLLSGDKAEGCEFEAAPKGVQRLFSISVWPLIRERHVTGSLIHVEDITVKRSREARMRQMESLASLTTLAAGVAHEIKNPLGSISIHVQLIQKTMEANKRLYFDAHPEETMESEMGPAMYFRNFDRYLNVVNEEIERLNHIVVDFLFAVRPMTMNMHSGEINKLLSELAEFVSFELKEAGITCTLELDDTIPLIDFDERYMKQVFLNLIKNATAAMPSGGRITIKTVAAEGIVTITVKDTGLGISEENISKIFEPYFTTKDTGSGLGLTLVFKIIREHLGEISVKSKPGEGSSFIITLPIPQKERHLIGAP